MLDRDLVALYGVPTKVLNQTVKRNIARFPDGFMFQLNHREMENWKSQFVTSNLSEADDAGLRMGLRRPPYAFTEILGTGPCASVIANRLFAIVDSNMI